MLADFADGRTEKHLPSLLAAIDAVKGWLVISAAHLFDLHRRVDEATQERFWKLLGRFRRIAHVRSRVRVAEFENVANAVRGRITPPTDATIATGIPLDWFLMQNALARLGDAVTWMHGTDIGVRQNRAKGHPPFPIAEAKRLMHAMIANRSLEDYYFAAVPIDAASSEVEKGLQTLLLSLDPQEFAHAIGVFKAIAPQLGMTVDALFDEVARRPGSAYTGVLFGAVPGLESKWSAIAPIAAPGLFLAETLTGRNQANVTRTPKVSDRFDVDHLIHAPYVDVITVDAGTHGPIEKALKNWRPVRKGIVLRNPGNWDALFEAILSCGAG